MHVCIEHFLLRNARNGRGKHGAVRVKYEAVVVRGRLDHNPIYLVFIGWLMAAQRKSGLDHCDSPPSLPQPKLAV